MTSAYEARLLRRYAELVGSRSGEGQRYVPQAPSAKQQAFLELTSREALYGGAAGGGKSSALLMAALQYVHVPGYAAIIFRRTYTDLALPGAIMDRSLEWLRGTDAKWNERDKTWRFPSGSTLTFAYLAGPRDHYRYQGAEFQFCAFDELTQFWEGPYVYLFSRLRRLAGSEVPIRMRAASNPGDIGHEWVKRRFIDEPEGRSFIPATLDDNAFIDHVEYEKSLAELDPVTQAQLRHGEWVRDTSGLVYGSFSDRCIVDSLPDLPEGERWTFILAADFGVVDPTAFAVLAFSDHDPNVYVVESAQWKDMAPSEAAEEAIRWERRYGGFDAIVGDVGGLGKGFEAEWRKRFALPMRAAQKTDKLGYIKLVNGDFHNKKLLILRAANEQLIKDVRALAWADDKHVKEHPTLPNHLPDAMLYGWREARHWDWSERAGPPLVGDAKILDEARERKERRMERAKRDADTDSNEWIIGPG